MHPRVQFLLIKISLWGSIYIEPFAGLVVKNYSNRYWSFKMKSSSVGQLVLRVIL